MRKCLAVDGATKTRCPKPQSIQLQAEVSGHKAVPSDCLHFHTHRSSASSHACLLIFVVGFCQPFTSIRDAAPWRPAGAASASVSRRHRRCTACQGLPTCARRLPMHPPRWRCRQQRPCAVESSGRSATRHGRRVMQVHNAGQAACWAFAPAAADREEGDVASAAGGDADSRLEPEQRGEHQRCHRADHDTRVCQPGAWRHRAASHVAAQA